MEKTAKKTSEKTAEKLAETTTEEHAEEDYDEEEPETDTMHVLKQLVLFLKRFIDVHISIQQLYT